MRSRQIYISGLVITYNEAHNIGACIDSLMRVCDEVIIIDSYSQDKTVEVCTKKGAKVYQQKYLGDGPQRVFGLQYCKNNWILNLDADERLGEDACEFILRGEYLSNRYGGYTFRRRNFLGDKEISFSGWYPDAICRFFNKEKAWPSDDMIHQRVKGKSLKEKNLHILHYGWKDYKQIIEKKNQYSDWHAKQMFDRGEKVYLVSPKIHGFWAFFTSYFIKNGIFHGTDGLALALIQGFFSHMKYVKLIHLYRKKKNLSRP